MRRGLIGVAVAAAVGLAAGTGVLAAQRADAHADRWNARQQVVAPRVSRTGVCDGVLVVRYDAVRLGPNRVWQPLMDDGSTRLEVHDSSGRTGPGGRWVGAVTKSGGEHVLRWDGYQTAVEQGAQIDLVRVVTGGYRSTGWPAQEPCS
jgi:hypothetical protein